MSAAELQRAGIASRELFTRGGWPELHVRPELDPVRYLDDHVRTFIEKDIAATAGIAKLREFRTFLGLLAARSGQLLNASEIGQHVGIKGHQGIDRSGVDRAFGREWRGRVCRDHRLLGIEIFLWRTRDGEELDFLVRLETSQRGPLWIPIEAKLGGHAALGAAIPPGLGKTVQPLEPMLLVPLDGERRPLPGGRLQVPLSLLPMN